MPLIPLQSGDPTLVPNLYPSRVMPDLSVSGEGKFGVMSAQAPADLVASTDPRVAASQTVTIGGSPGAGDVVRVTLALPSGSHTTSITLVGSPTVDEVAELLTTAINNDSVMSAAGVYASAAAAVVTVKQGGPIGNSMGLVSGTTQVGGTTTATRGGATLAGGSGPIVPTKNFTFQFENATLVFWYGIPQDVTYNVLLALIAAGASIV